MERRAPTALRFAGQYADDETGLYYNLARYYAPELGRYISRDPLESASGPNPYLYCYNDPLGGRDPTGLLSGWAKIAVAAAAIAVGVVVIVVAAPVVIAAVAGAAVTASAIGCAAAVAAGAGLVGVGVGLGLAPDGCVACQKKMAIDMGIAFAGAALTGMSMALFPPLAGAGLALAGGGAVGDGSALGMAGVAAGVLGVLGAGQHAMSGTSEGGPGEGEGKAESPSDERRRLIKKPPDGHAFEKHGGAVTDEQLETRARTGVAPGGSTGPNGSIPPESSAFHSDEDLIRADQAVRNGPLQDQIAQNPNATKLRINNADVGFDAGRSYSRVGPSQQSPASPSQGPLQRTDGVTRVTGTYVKNPNTGEWETVTLYPDP